MKGRNERSVFENSPFQHQGGLLAEPWFGSPDLEIDDQRWVQTFWSEVLFSESSRATMSVVHT